MTRVVAVHARDDIRLETRDDPPLARDEVRVRVAHVGICGSDLHVFQSLEHAELPWVPGHEYSGVVEDAGAGVTTIAVGDRVVCKPRIACGTCRACRSGRPTVCEAFDLRVGAFAERVALPETFVERIPDALPLRIASLTEPLSCALRAFDRTDVAGRNAVVIGGGPIGLLTASIARHHGAEQVLVVEPSPIRRGLADRLGLPTIDPREHDTAEAVRAATGGRGADVAYEAVGGARHLETALRCLARGGTAAVVGVAPPGDLAQVDVYRIFDDELAIVGVFGIETTFGKAIALLEVLDLEPLVTHEFALDEAGDALRLAESAQCGKVLVTP
jgi:L-iditol 2-dehydrogenase